MGVAHWHTSKEVCASGAKCTPILAHWHTTQLCRSVPCASNCQNNGIEAAHATMQYGQRAPISNTAAVNNQVTNAKPSACPIKNILQNQAANFAPAKMAKPMKNGAM